MINGIFSVYFGLVQKIFMHLTILKECADIYDWRMILEGGGGVLRVCIVRRCTTIVTTGRNRVQREKFLNQSKIHAKDNINRVQS